MYNLIDKFFYKSSLSEIHDLTLIFVLFIELKIGIIKFFYNFALRISE